LNSQIVPKIAKWIWKTELEKTFGKKREPFLVWTKSGLPLFLFSFPKPKGPVYLNRIISFLRPGKQLAVDAFVITGAKMRATDLRRPPLSISTSC
jgi:hypothetical protein